MAKAKPVNTTKKNSFWSGLRYFLRTLFSNGACVDGKEKRWYWPVLVAVLSALIATIPTLVSRFSVKASSFFTSGFLYSYDHSLDAFNNAAKDVSMKVNNGVLTLDESAWSSINNPASPESAYKYWGYYYIVPVEVTEETPKSKIELGKIITKTDVKYCGLAVYYSGDEHSYTYAKKVLLAATNDPNAQLSHPRKDYSTDIIVIGKTDLYIAKGTKGSAAPKSSVVIKYDHPSFQGKDLKSFMLADANRTTIEAWSSLLDMGYDSTRNTVAWEYSGIMLGISAGTILLMGVLVFVMTRGKNNPYNFYTFWQSQKIAYWASAMPALLSLLSMLPALSTFGMFMFPMLLILRSTWMSMKTLRPVQQ